MLLFSGYNGFQQLSALCTENSELFLNDVISEFVSIEIPYENVIASASWSSILFIKGNAITICGFLNGMTGQSVSPPPPFKENVIQGSVANEGYTFVTEIGQLWHFNCEKKSWKNLSHLLTTEINSLPPTGRIVKVCSGKTLTAAISDTGIAYCLPNVFSEIHGVIDVACGKEHGVLLTDKGTVLTWGGGSRGQLGNGCLDNCEIPFEVEALSGLKVVKIAAGGWHSAAITDEGDIYTWGWNKQGQLGFPLLQERTENGVSVLAVPEPVDMPEGAFIEDVSCGASHTIIKLKDGSILGCGWNKWGQLGLKGVKCCDQMTLLLPTTKGPVQKIVCGPWNTFIFTG